MADEVNGVCLSFDHWGDGPRHHKAVLTPAERWIWLSYVVYAERCYPIAVMNPSEEYLVPPTMEFMAEWAGVSIEEVKAATKTFFEIGILKKKIYWEING